MKRKRQKYKKNPKLLFKRNKKFQLKKLKFNNSKFKLKN